MTSQGESYIFMSEGAVFMKPDYVAIGARLKEARTLSKITQQELANFMDVSVSYVKNTERGGKPSLEYLLVVSEKCQVSVDWLLTGVQKENNRDIENTASTQKIEAVFDPDLKRMIDILKELMENENKNLRGWTIIQFEEAFKQHCATYDEKKDQA
jgi:transcriptional regulator with XRE-family HTH domain